jgi:hypothetical protein
MARRRSRSLATLALTGSLALGALTASTSVWAQVDAAKVRQAAEQFDAGAAAFNAKDYEGAASRFEAADSAVPSERALRSAIRARVEAGQKSRAATLAALALARYPNDASTSKLARDTLSKLEKDLHKLSVSCASPCVLAVGTRSIHGEATTRWTLYLDPGAVAVSASFFGKVTAKPAQVTAKAGSASEVRFEPEEAAPSKPPEVPGKPEGPGEPGPGKPDGAPTGAGPTGAKPSGEGPTGGPAEGPSDAPKRKGLHPGVFAAGVVLTAAAGGVLVWSGVDALGNPGPDAVRAGCRGQGEACPLYQQGLDAQTRTNALIGVTAGLGAVTVLLAIFTDFGGSKAAPKASEKVGAADRALAARRAAPPRRPSFVALPLAGASPEGGFAGLDLRF